MQYPSRNRRMSVQRTLYWHVFCDAVHEGRYLNVQDKLIVQGAGEKSAHLSVCIADENLQESIGAF